MSDTPPMPTRADYAGPNARNPFGTEIATRPVGALANAEQQRSIAEVQARMIIARSNPRDPIRCMDLILRDCTRPTLAEKGLYQYARGGSSISGPSIRLAEAIAQRWGNIASGIKELSRSGGYSECVAYAWDLETGYYDERQYQVRHWRDTKGGGYAITDEREIYELLANMGQRRKRACLLTVIPGDVVEAATEQCEQTLHVTADTSPDALQKVLDAFEQFNVSRAQLEKRCQCRFEAVRPAQIVQLRKIYASIKDGMSDATNWFDAPNGVWSEVDKAHEAAKPAAAQTTTRTRRTKAEMEAARAAEAQSTDEPAAPSAPKQTTQDEVPFGRWDDETQSKPAETQQDAFPVQEVSGGVSVGSELGGIDDVTPRPAEFEVWLMDGEGNYLADADGVIEAFTDPVAFAQAYVDALANEFPGTADLFKRANHDSLALAMQHSTKVAPILVAAERKPEPPAATESPTLPMSLPIDPAFVPPPTKSTPAEFNSFNDRLKVVLAMEATPEWINTVIDRNASAYEKFPPKYRLDAKALVEARQKEISPAPVRGTPAQSNADLTESLLHDVYSLVSAESVDTWVAMPAVKAGIDKLFTEDARLHDRVATAIAAKRVEFKQTPRQIADRMLAGIAACADGEAIKRFGMVRENLLAGQQLAKDAPEMWAEVTAAVQARGRAALV